MPGVLIKIMALTHKNGTAAAILNGDNTKAIKEVQSEVADIINSGGAQPPLIGDVDNITPNQVISAIQEGRDVCITTPSSLGTASLMLKFTAFNYAKDITYNGALINAVVSQTIAIYNNTYYLYELVGLYNGGWSVASTALAQKSDISESLFYCETKQILNSETISTGGGQKYDTVTWTKAGYFPLGVVGWNSPDTSAFVPSRLRLSSQSLGSVTLSYCIRNVSSGSQTGDFKVDILWLKVTA